MHSIASLIQRVGRSGRREGQTSSLFLYATDGWKLLQSLACWQLYKEGFIEPPQFREKPYDILLHQSLSITKEKSGIKEAELIGHLKDNAAFRQIQIGEIEEIKNHLTQIDFLEKLQDELIIGLEGEKIVNSRDFYSMFSAEVNLKVVNAGNTIGEIPFSTQIVENENIYLAARIWKITNVDFDANLISVIPANDGKKPKFSGAVTVIHPRIWQKMLEIIFSSDLFEKLDESGRNEIETMRKEFSVFKITDTRFERPLMVTETGAELFTFTGIKINRTILFLLDLAEIKYISHSVSSSFEMEISYDHFLNVWNSLLKFLTEIDLHIENLLQKSPGILGFSKWGEYLPVKFQIESIKKSFYDFTGAEQFLSEYKIVRNA